MPYILNTSQGRVSELIGSALIRGADGKMRPLHLGDIVHQGDLLLTTQDGIVQITPEPVIARLQALPPEIAKAIVAIEKDAPPTAGLLPEDGSVRDPGLRVARVDEQLGQSFVQTTPVAVPAPSEFQARQQHKLVSATVDGIVAFEEGPSVNLGLALPPQPATITALTIAHLPLIGEIHKADGSLLTVNTLLSTADLSGLRYLPPADYDGHSAVGDFSISITRTVGTETQAVHIHLIPVNDRPLALSDNGSVAEDTPVHIALTGQDVDGVISSVSLVSLPTGGRMLLADGVTQVQAGQSISAAQAANLSWQAAPDFNGPAEITFTLTDDGGSVSALARYALQVTPVNDAPVPRADAVQVLEDHGALIEPLRNDSDVEADALRIVALGGQPTTVGQPLVLPEGLLTLNADGTLGFAPAPNFNGAVRVLYAVSDGQLTSDAAITITVTPVNDAPVAAPDLASTLINAPVDLAVLANDIDVDGDRLAVRQAALDDPTRGTLTILPDGTMHFVPASNVTGPVGISYTIADPSGATSTSSATVHIGPNTAPTARDFGITMPEDNHHAFSATDFGFSDADAGQSLANIRIDTLPGAGVLALNGAGVRPGEVIAAGALGNVTFSPQLNANGLDYALFTFSVQDSAGAFSRTSNTVHVSVTPVNDAPVAVADLAITPEDTAIQLSSAQLLGNDIDVDGDALHITSVTSATGGTAVLNPDGSVTFTPNANFNGPATFIYVANDGTVNGGPASVTVDVTPVNDAPVASADVVNALEDTPLVISAVQLLGNDTDVDGNALHIASVAIGAGGTAVLNADGSVTFTPDSNFNGAASFSYVASDGIALSNTAVVAVNVAPVNDAPVANPDITSTAEDTPVVLPAALLLGNDTDIDGNLLHVASVTSGSSGTATLNPDGSVTFTPNPNFNGLASFSYTAGDGSATSNTTTVTVNVTPVNDAPVAIADAAVTTEDTTVVIAAAQLLGNDVDIDGSVLRIASVSNGAGGTAVLNADGTVTFTPLANFNGAASFSYVATDGSAASNVAQVTMNVTPVNDAPIAVADTVGTLEDAAVVLTAAQLLGNDLDIDGDALRIVSVLSGTGGTAILNADGTVTFTPTTNFNGAASFSYVANDGTVNSNSAVVTVNVAPVNDAPLANADVAKANQGQPLTLSAASLLANDTDIDTGDTLTVRSVQGAVNGSVALDAQGNVVFTPSTGFTGAASFSYTISDTAGATSTASVAVDVVQSVASPTLLVPSGLFGLHSGSASMTSSLPPNLPVLLQAGAEATLGIFPGTLDNFDPPPGPLNALFNVDVTSLDFTTYSIAMNAGNKMAFNWSFFNGENLDFEILQGFNDMVIVVVTDPNGVQQIVQLTSSEQLGVNSNGPLVDATGLFQFTAVTSGDYQFSWLVTDGRDFHKGSSLTVTEAGFTTPAGTFGMPVEFPIEAALATPLPGQTLSVTVTNVPLDAAFSTGVNHGGGVWTFTPAQLDGLNYLPGVDFAGTVNLSVTATATDASGATGTSAPVIVPVTVEATANDIMGTQNADTLVGTAGNDLLEGFGANDTLSGQDGNDLIYGDAGSDVLSGGNGNDVLVGGGGTDTLDGGAGNDVLRGGAGNDILTGGLGVDVFAWTLADKGIGGAPAIDTITDFSAATIPGAGDVLDLRDLLQGEVKAGFGAGNLEQFLDFDTTTTAGSTIIRVSSTGGFAGGVYNAATEDERIVLQGVDLRSSAIFGLSAAASDNQIVQQLLQHGSLVVNGP